MTGFLNFEVEMVCSQGRESLGIKYTLRIKNLSCVCKLNDHLTVFVLMVQETKSCWKEEEKVLQTGQEQNKGEEER